MSKESTKWCFVPSVFLALTLLVASWLSIVFGLIAWAIKSTAALWWTDIVLSALVGAVFTFICYRDACDEDDDEGPEYFNEPFTWGGEIIEYWKSFLLYNPPVLLFSTIGKIWLKRAVRDTEVSAGLE